MTDLNRQWIRKANLLVIAGTNGIDLSEMRFVFSVQASDFQSPNHASIRVYNLRPETQRQVREEFTRVVIQAGYQQAAYGVVFDGSIKQFREGRENATDTFLDILAADSDVGYNFGIVNHSFAAGSTPDQWAKVAAKSMDVDLSDIDLTGVSPQRLARGKVGFGMGRDLMRKAANTLNSTWSIQNGVAQVIPMQGYLPGDAVVINSLTGMIGIPDQTEEGIRVRSLLNPKLKIGGTIRLNNKDITRLTQQNPNDPVPFNQWTGIQFAAKIADGSDGLYRLYVVEHTGDTRGNDWHSDMVCLAISQSSQKVEAVD